jgi:hypothetical protein
MLLVSLLVKGIFWVQALAKPRNPTGGILLLEVKSPLLVRPRADYRLKFGNISLQYSFYRRCLGIVLILYYWELLQSRFLDSFQSSSVHDSMDIYATIG